MIIYQLFIIVNLSCQRRFVTDMTLLVGIITVIGLKAEHIILHQVLTLLHGGMQSLRCKIVEVHVQSLD